MEAKKVLNILHKRLAVEMFTEIELSEVRGEDIMVLHRHQPDGHRSCYFFIYTAYHRGGINQPYEGGTMEIKGAVEQIVLEARLSTPHNCSPFEEKNRINGLPSCLTISAAAEDLQSQLGLFGMNYDPGLDVTRIRMLSGFRPGCVFVLMTKGYPTVRESVANSIRSIESVIEISNDAGEAVELSRSDELQAYNYLVYSCCSEELDRSKGRRGCYELA